MDSQRRPINHFRIELADKIYAAMEMEMERRALEEKVLKTNVSDRSSALFDLPVCDLLGLSVDMDAIERKKAEASSNFQQAQRKFDSALSDLAAANPICAELSVSILEGFYAPDDLDGLIKYAKAVVAWMEDNRKHLVELLAHTQVLLGEKEDNEERERQERALLEEILRQSDSLKAYTSRTRARLDDLQRDGGPPPPILKQTPGRLDHEYEESEDHQSSTRVFMFQQIQDGLLHCTESISSCNQRATILNDNLGEAIAKHQFTPTHEIQLDHQSTLERILAEEFQALFAPFHDELSTEMDERNRKSYTHLLGTLSDANKLACKLMINSLGDQEPIAEATPIGSLN